MQTVKLDSLIPDSKNANRGTDRGRELVKHSLKEYGAGRSILLDKSGQVIAGNKSLEQAKALGFESVLVVETDGKQLVAVKRTDIDLDSKAGRELAIADNRTSELGLEWDNEVILELADTIDMSPFWNESELDEFLSNFNAGPSQEELQGLDDTVPEADKINEKWQVQFGDLWQIGKHRILCGDSLKQDSYKTLLGSVKPDFVVSDPPYGINIVATNGYVGNDEAYNIPFGGIKNRRGSDGASKPFGSQPKTTGSDGASNVISVGKYAVIKGDATTETAVFASNLCLELFVDATQFWWGGNYYASSLPDSSCWIVWDKENTGNFADAELAWSNHESSVRIYKHMWNGMVKASEHGQRRVHPTQKPIALSLWLYENYGKAGMNILDPFAGSASSFVAAEKHGSCMYGIEYEPAYVAVCLERLSQLGLEPKKLELVA
jgi:sporulation protein YlmC with PRC-barrel domain